MSVERYYTGDEIRTLAGRINDFSSESTDGRLVLMDTTSNVIDGDATTDVKNILLQSVKEQEKLLKIIATKRTVSAANIVILEEEVAELHRKIESIASLARQTKEIGKGCGSFLVNAEAIDSILDIAEGRSNG